MDASMKVKKPESTSEPCVVELHGEIDVFASPAIKASLVDLVKEGHSLLAIDFADVSYIDSTGLGALIAALKRAREKGGAVAVVCANQQIRRIFEITGLSKAFAMYDTLDPALEELRGNAATAKA
jgi:anti-sigma B factor antagonist